MEEKSSTFGFTIARWLASIRAFLAEDIRVVFVALVFSLQITERVRSYVALFLLLETASIGVFVALDAILFYVFFEVTLVGMYFIIADWGYEGRERAALTFFIYTLLGSLPLLLAIRELVALRRWRDDGSPGPDRPVVPKPLPSPPGHGLALKPLPACLIPVRQPELAPERRTRVLEPA